MKKANEQIKTLVKETTEQLNALSVEVVNDLISKDKGRNIPTSDLARYATKQLTRLNDIYSVADELTNEFYCKASDYQRKELRGEVNTNLYEELNETLNQINLLDDKYTTLEDELTKLIDVYERLEELSYRLEEV